MDSHTSSPPVFPPELVRRAFLDTWDCGLLHPALWPAPSVGFEVSYALVCVCFHQADSCLAWPAGCASL